MDYINKSFPKRFLVENELEISAIVSEAKHFLVKMAFKRLDNRSDPLNTERLFNEPSEFEW